MKREGILHPSEGANTANDDDEAAKKGMMTGRRGESGRTEHTTNMVSHTLLPAGIGTAALSLC